MLPGCLRSKRHVDCNDLSGAIIKKVLMVNNIRIEEDLLGMREVPADAYYGVHTLRAIENFYISNSKISDIPEFVRGMVMVKKLPRWRTKSCKPFPATSLTRSLQPAMKCSITANAWISSPSMSIRAAQVRQSI